MRIFRGTHTHTHTHTPKKTTHHEQDTGPAAADEECNGEKAAQIAAPFAQIP